MPFYDVTRSTSTNGTTLTSSTHLWAKTAANQETLSIMGVFATARSSSAGGATLNVLQNTGTTASGGTANTPGIKNMRLPAAQSSWADDTSAITVGTTLKTRIAFGFAQTGGQGGYVPIVPGDAIQMMPNATNPVDVEFASVAVGTSIPFTLTVDFQEGTC
jgi:hypothetical protein